MKIAIDAMGGDHAPKAVVLGAIKAVETFSDIHITLVGKEEEIRKYLTKEERISILHTDEIIEATDEPVRAFNAHDRLHCGFRNRGGGLRIGCRCRLDTGT